MFRYIAFAWDESHSESSALALRFGRDCQSRKGWDAVIIRPGLQTFTAGTSPGVNEAIPLQGGQGVILGKLFRRAGFDSHPAPSATLTSRDAARALDSGGRTLISDFWGRYVALLQTSSGTTCVLRDPSGTLPCFRIRHEGISIVFSWLADALELLADMPAPLVNWDALIAQLLTGPLIGRETALQGVLQVLPGESFDLHTEASELLWNAADIGRSVSELDADEASVLLKCAVRSCARAWANCYDTLLLRLSGGVDSSILLSCLGAHDTQADVICVNYHSPGSDSDERHYARLAAVKISRDLLERERTPEFPIDRILGMAPMPDPIPYVGWMNAATDARLASAYRAAAMFTGAGGDPLFFEYARWWPAADYLQTRGLDTGFAAAALDAARLGKVSVWRAISLALGERLSPKPGARRQTSYAGLLAPGLEHEVDQQRFVHPALLNANDLPIGKYMQTVALMQPLGYYDPFEQAAAPELVNPLFSQPLVELCLQLPTYMLTQGGRGRALARHAFAQDIPVQIANRRSKGGMEEHIKAVLDFNLGFVRSMLLDGELGRRGLLDRRKAEELLSGRPTALAGPISQIHGLVAVEAWLSRWNK